jgi:hypothetical protein
MLYLGLSCFVQELEGDTQRITAKPCEMMINHRTGKSDSSCGLVALLSHQLKLFLPFPVCAAET